MIDKFRKPRTVAAVSPAPTPPVDTSAKANSKGTAQVPSLRIVYVVGSLQYGGVERYAVDLSKAMRARGHEVEVLALMDGGPLASELRDAGIRFHVLGVESFVGRSSNGTVDLVKTVRNGWRLLCLVVLLFRKRPDVVQAFLLWPSAIGLVAAALARVPIRVSTRANLGTDPSLKQFPRVERVVEAVSHHVSAISRAVAATVPGDAEKTVIYPAVQERPTAPDVGRQPASGIIVANLIQYKGHAVLIEALSLLDEPPRMTLIGVGPEHASLKALVEELGLGEVVTLVGSVPTTSPYFLSSQFAVLCSHQEGLGIALMEALSYGLPCIATQVGGMPEVVRHGESGLIVPAADPAALADAIQRLSRDPAMRMTFGLNGQRDMRLRFSWAACAGDHESLYLRDAPAGVRGRRVRGTRRVRSGRQR